MAGNFQAVFLAAVENGFDGGEALGVGEMALAAGDSALEEIGASAGALHVGVVVAFDGQEIDAGEMFDQSFGDGAEIGGVADFCFRVFKEEGVGAVDVVGEMEGGDVGVRCRLEGVGIERMNQGSELLVAGDL